MKLLGVKSGRTWTVDGRQQEESTYKGEGAVASASEVYLLQRTQPADFYCDWRDVHTLEHITWDDANELPKVGDPHNAEDGSMLRVSSISFREGTDAERKYIEATVNYVRMANSSETQTIEEQGSYVCYCESWGWSNGSVARDITDYDGGPIVNTAGDPYDSVPQYDFPSPVFHKVFKTKTRIPGIVAMHGKVNNTSITIGGQSYAAGTLRIVQAEEERLFSDAGGFVYRYSIGLQYLSNKMADVFTYNTTTKAWTRSQNVEVGWAFVVANTGLRALDDNGDLQRITDKDENGNVVPVSLPVALDDQGKRLATTGGDSLYYYAYSVYKPTTFLSVFYSEPAIYNPATGATEAAS